MRLYFQDSWEDRLPAFFFQNRSSLQLLGLYLGFLIAPCLLIAFIYLLFSSDLAIVLTLSALVVALFSLLFCVWLLAWILKHDCGSQAMQDVSEPIKEGSEGFFRTQYGTIFRLAIIFAILLFLLYIFQRGSSADRIFGATSTAIITSLSFMFGAVCSALSGYAGMWVSVRTNIRVTSAARRCYNEALQLCFRGGAFGAIINVALAIFGISFQYLLLRMFISIESSSFTDQQVRQAIKEIPLKLVGFGFGASFVAMFAQLGGGIYTKAADVGADLVGKVEQGIPEDDARNPAVIADLVGDNVGDCAGQAADLFESISAEIISVMILGGEICHVLNINESLQAGFVLFPLGVHCLDLVASSFGLFFVRTKRGIAAAFSSIDFDEEDEEIVNIQEEEDDLGGSTSTNIAAPSKKKSKGNELKNKPNSTYHDAPVSGLQEPLDVMKRGYYVAIVVGLIGFYLLSTQLLSFTTNPSDRSSLFFFGCGVVGMIVSYLFVIITQYYTDYNHTPVRNIAKSSVTGHATNIIAGLSVGLESTALPIIVIAISILLTFNLGSMALTDSQKLLNMSDITQAQTLSVGLFATAVATMGMFSTGVFVLSMSGFGPIADNAGGIAQMSHQEGHIRVITDKLDAVGNVTKANTKGYSVGSASLACFLMFSAYLDEVQNSTTNFNKVIDISKPPIFIGGLLGSMVVFLFSSWAILAVGNAAQDVINEVVRQFKEYPEIMEYKHKPNYGGCVAIVAKAGLREMIKPGLLSVIAPILVGVLFKLIGKYNGDEHLGAQVTAGFLMFATATGILMALFFNNAGGAWDNAKKYIETGQFGGKGSPAHKAAVTGDTVGDPCKDTAGPSIHILIKLLSTVTLVMAPLLV